MTRAMETQKMADEYDRMCEIVECSMCDDHGMNGMYRCDHVDYRAAAKRGMDLIRAALKKGNDV